MMKIQLIAALTIILTATACSSTVASQTKESKTEFNTIDVSTLVGKSYELEMVNGKIYKPLETNSKPTLKFSKRNDKIFASGNATCNNYNGPVKTNVERFIVAPIMSTRMMCAGGGTTMERDFLRILAQGSNLSIVNGKLLLDTGSHSFTLREK